MPTLTYDSKDAIPEDLLEAAQEIKEDGENKGKWAVNVVPRKKLEEFRDTNVTLAKKAKDAEDLIKKVVLATGATSVEDFDFDKFSTDFSGLKETARKVADGKLKASDDLDKIVSERTEVMRSKLDEQLQQKQIELNAMKLERDKAVADYLLTFIDRAVSSAITDPELGVEPTAADDIRVRAYNVFKVEQDRSLRPERNGQTLWGEDGSTPMSMKEWINIVLRKEAPHYFKKSGGGGASGGADTKQFGGLSEAEFNKLPARRRLEIANEAAFKGSAKR